MKILFPLGTLYPSQAGGPSNTIYWLAKALVKKGVEVSIVTTHIGAENKVSVNKAIETEYGKVTYFSDNIDQLPFQLMVNALRQVRHHDCIHLTSIFYPPSFIIATAAKWMKKPVIWSCRGNLHHHALQISAWKKRPVLWYIKKYLSGRVTFHATSTEESEHIRRIFGPAVKIVEVPNYIELPEPIPHDFEGKPYLLYVGRIHHIKALDKLLEAIHIAVNFKKSDMPFKIAGDADNDFGRALKRLVSEMGLSERIEFLGQVEGLEKQQLYAAAKFTILPSNSENFGNVVIESLAQGTPAIASTGTPWQILETERAGFWTKNDPEELSLAINRALSLSADEYRAYRQHALALARKKFDVFENVNQWMDVYQSVINNHSSSLDDNGTTKDSGQRHHPDIQ